MLLAARSGVMRCLSALHSRSLGLHTAGFTVPCFKTMVPLRTEPSAVIHIGAVSIYFPGYATQTFVRVTDTLETLKFL